MIRKIFAVALLGATSFASAAHAATIAALVGDDTIAIVDTSALKVTRRVRRRTERLREFWASTCAVDGMLYARTALARVDHRSQERVWHRGNGNWIWRRHRPGDGRFQSVADRLRVMGADGTNLRINVDDGKVTKDGGLKFADGDMHKGEKPNVIAGSYTNPVKGAKETTPYNIDATIGALLRQRRQTMVF